MTTAQEIMTRDPVVCAESEPIVRAVEVMRDRDTGVVPIVDDGGRCVGIVTDRDLCLDVILKGMDPKTTPLFRVMHANLLTCLPEHSLEEVIDRMARRQVKRILVVSEAEGRCVGIISETDLATRADPEALGKLTCAVYG